MSDWITSAWNSHALQSVLAICSVVLTAAAILLFISSIKRRRAAINAIGLISWRSSWKRNWILYLMMSVGIAFFIIFMYLPMFGILIAFKRYSPYSGVEGIFTSDWVGFLWFRKFFSSVYAWRLVRNSLVISLKKLIVNFPAPIILALMLNAVPGMKFKKSIQSISYLPHFLSMVVVCSIVRTIVSVDGGLINGIIQFFGGQPIVFLGVTKYFQGILVISDLWRTIGWGSIIYLAAMTGIDPELYEAATVDGANWYHKIRHVTLPAIAPIISLMFILRCGQLLNAGFEQIFLLYSSPVYEVADIIDTYVYREGLINLNYSYSTAVNIFKSVIAMILVLFSNFFAKKLGQEGIW